MRPTLTPEERAALEAEKVREDNFSSLLSQTQANLQERIEELENIDSSFKKFFDYYNDDIIGNYDLERTAIDGKYPVDPVNEQDIQDSGNLNGAGRITPTPPDTDVIRIQEFDGLPLSNLGNEIDNELYFIQRQQLIEDYLVNGFGGTVPTGDVSNLLTTTVFDNTGSITTVSLEDTVSASLPTFVAGDRFLLTDGLQYIPVEVVSATSSGGAGTCSNPIYTDQATCELNGETWTPGVGGTIELEVTVLTSPSTVRSLAIEATVDITFIGFDNTERTNKVASRQSLLDDLIDELEFNINGRISRLADQKTALQANLDDDIDTNAEILVDNSFSFLTSYLTTTDISDTGLAGLSSERLSRETEANTRVTTIILAYTGQTENYYDQRYIFANNRGNTEIGTVRQLNFSSDVAGTNQGYKDSADELSQTYGDLLNES